MSDPIRMVSVPVEPTGPYSAEFGAIHHEAERGYLFSIHPESAAKEVARALNHAAAVEAAATAAPVREEGGAVKRRTFKDERAQKAYDLFFREGWMRGDIERFYRSGFAGVARPDEAGSPRDAVWLAGRDRAEAGLPHGIPDRPEFRNLIAALATREEAPAEAGELADAVERTKAHRERAHPNHKTMFIDIADLDLILSALRAQPQAREEAQPVGLDVLEGWEDPKTPSVPGPVAWRCRNIGGTWFYREARQQNVAVCEPIYDHPAPTPPAPVAEKLRVAASSLELAAKRFEALREQTDHVPHRIACSEWAEEARQALAALQQEGPK